ncbi:LacI family DNA-binding transcriptional regulator [Actinobaculum suis]|uniref:LacI family DNA-binding transcriptional regulator n=1 Tax=Actinobaculum suis TaxID=1657 RepID=UPI0008086B70|nr:LacI family DNA-binding transcriptional regulator [Actinobaculum suis]OCA93608.1 hypothetical protein ACU20_08665 [Actinobaculum suis]OCA93884.1 hypothetical protein ACU21_08975 [Actinobaculum suis]
MSSGKTRKRRGPSINKPRIKDVAKLAGVSVGTVSNVINKRESVDPELAQRVEEAMADLHYQPNVAAQSLRRGVGNMVGVIVLDITNPFFSGVVAGIENRLSPERLLVAVSSTGEDSRREQEVLKTFATYKPRGIILTPTSSMTDHIRSLRDSGIPVLLLDSRLKNPEIPSIAVDDFQGAYLAVGHLVELEHRNILFISGPKSLRQTRDRLSGALSAIESSGHSRSSQSRQVRLSHLEIPRFDAAEARVAVQDLLKKCGLLPFWDASTPSSADGFAQLPANFPTAFFCASDQIAFGAMTALRDAGVRIPEQVSLVGFDDIPIAAQTSIPLTTVRQDTEKLGYEAADMLLTAEEKIEHRTLMPQLVVRKSTAPPRLVRVSSRS